MLTDLQRRVRGIVASLPEGAAVALAGGGALIVTGVVRRGTDNLDFFAAHPQPVAPMLDAFETGLRETGLRVTRLRYAQQRHKTNARKCVMSRECGHAHRSWASTEGGYVIESAVVTG